MQLRPIIATIALAIGQTAFAQTLQNGVGDFTIERVLALSGVTAPTAPNLPAPVLAGIQAGAIEIHQILAYNSAQRTIEQTAFVVPGKSPLPFPNPGAAPIADHYIIQVDSSTTTNQPGQSAVLTGHVISNDVPTPFGTITGAIVTLSFGYQGSGASVQFGPIMQSVSPLYGLYSPTGAGSLSTTPAAAKCGLGSLNGTYMFRMSGWWQLNGVFTPYANNGRFIADGNGNMTVLDGINVNGTAALNRNFPATYVIDDFCSGQIKFTGGAMDMQVSRDGRNVNLLFSQPSSVIASGNGSIQ